MITYIIACLVFIGYITIYYFRYIKNEKAISPEVRYVEKKYKIRLKKCEKAILKRRIGVYYALVLAVVVLLCLDGENIIWSLVFALFMYVMCFLFGLALLNRYGMKKKFMREAKKKRKPKQVKK